MVWYVSDEANSGKSDVGTGENTLAVMGASGLTPASTNGLTASTLAALGIDANSAAWGKLQAGLGNLFAESQLAAMGTNGAARAALMSGFQSSNTVAPVSGGYVTIDAAALDGNGAALLANLQALGLRGGAAVGAAISGYLPLDAIDEMAALGNLAFARPAYAGTSAGSVHNQADTSMYSDWLKGISGLTGAGVTVGVMSDSFDTKIATNIRYTTDVATGDLPGDLKVLLDAPNGSDEGRGMAQLVYDVAPGAKQAFYTAFSGQAGFAQGITELSNISKIVVDDVFYYLEPFFSDGIIAKAVDAAVATGDMYFSSAGNYGASSYQAQFVDSGQTYVNPTTGVVYRLHNFNPGGTVDTTQRVNQSGNTNYVLQWDQPFFSVNPGTGGSANDLALIMRTTSGGVIVIGDDSNVGRDPAEFIGLSGAGAFDISIGVRVGTVDPGLIKYIAFNTGFQFTEYGTASSANFGHSNAAGAIAVAAAPFYGTPAYDSANPPRSENFTSKGGTPILFDGNGARLATAVDRGTVDFTAPDGGNTTFFGSDTSFDTDTLPNFFGTSAAAPNAAALAALLWEKYPTATNAQIEAAMKASAVDITSSYLTTATTSQRTVYTGLVGYDQFTGTGLIRAQEALTILGQMLGVVNSAPVGIDKTVASPSTGFYKIGFNDLYTDVNGNPLATFTVGTVTTNAATITLNGVAVTNGQVISGTDIEQGLLRYTPTAGSEATASGSISFTLKDTGGTANGGSDTDSTPNTLTFATGPRNAAPTSANFLGDVATYSINGTSGGTPVKLDTGTAATITDADSADFAGGSLRLRIANAVTTEDRLLVDASGNGATGTVLTAGTSITVGGTVIGTVAAGSTAYDATITLNASATAAKVASLLSSVSYANSNASNPTVSVREIQITLNDGDGTTNGGTDTLVLTSAVNVEYVNVPPDSSNVVLTINEDVSTPLYDTYFPFTDTDGNYLLAVKITTLPSLGTLRVAGVAATAGQIVTYAQLAAGSLTYVSGANGNGNGYASFTFQVQDNGGTTGGGTDTDPTPNSFTFNVAPVNDTPTVSIAPPPTAISSEILVNTATAGNQGNQQITGLTGGGFVVVWSDASAGVGGAAGDASGLAVKLQVFTAAGSRAGSEVRVNTAVANDQTLPVVSSLTGGGFVVAWRDGSLGVGGATGDTSLTAVKAQVFTSAGALTGTEILVNTATANGQSDPRITSLANGNFVITWTDGSNGMGGAAGDSTGTAVKGQIFTVAGAAVGGEFLVNTATAGAQGDARITALSNGGFVVAWNDESAGIGGAGGDTSSVAVKAQVFTAFGALSGTEILVNTSTASTQIDPVIVALTGGGFAVTWTDYSGQGGDAAGAAIKTRVFSAGGTPVDSEMLVNSATAGDQISPQVAALANGGFVVTWWDPSQGVGGAGGDTASYAIKGQVFSATGALVGSEFLVNTAVADGQYNQQVVALPNGNFVVAWQDLSLGVGGATGDATGAAVKAQVFTGGGAKVGPEMLVNQTTASDQSSPVIAALTNGNWAVAWTDLGQTGDASGSAVAARVMGPATSFFATEQVARNLKGTLSINDVDADGPTYSATISSTYGIINVSAGGSGATIGTGNGTGSVTITGTRAQINALLSTDATSTVTYTANTDAPPASATLTLAVNDGGSSGSGVALTGSATRTISITVVNDAPTLTGVPATVSATSGGNPTPLFAGSTLTDVDYSNYAVGGGMTVAASAGDTLSLLATSPFTAPGGTLTHNTAGAIGTITGLGTANVGVTFSGAATAALIDALSKAFGLTLGNTSSTGAHPVTLTFTDNGTPALQASGTQTVQLDYNFVTLGAGQTSATGTAGPDYISGNATNDTISGLAGDDRLFGNDGNDVLNGGSGADVLDGGNGVDTANYGDAAGAVLIDLTARTATETALTSGTVNGSTAVVSTDLVIAIENAIGSAYGDRFYGTTGNNVITPGAGNDIAYGNGGTDTIDYSNAMGAVFLDMTPQTIYETALTSGTVNGSTAVVGTDLAFGFANAIGSAYGDRYYGTAGDNVFAPGAGNDIAYGQGGTDTIDYSNAAGAVYIDLGQSMVIETALTTGTVSSATAAISTDYVSGFTNAIGSAFGDRFYGSTAANQVDGGAGADVLYGGDGNDVILGGDGDDKLIGENGADTLTGGNGADQFYFVGGETGGADTITDFAVGIDKLWFMGSNFGTAAGGTATLVVGTNPQAVAPNTFLYDTSTGMLSFDADGSGPGAAVALVNIGAGQAITTNDLVFF